MSGSIPSSHGTPPSMPRSPSCIALYTRPLREDELVLSVDEKTSLQPRPRRAPTLPAQPQNMPNRHEHESKRAGARNLFAAFDTRSGKVYGHCSDRKRQRECMAFLEAVDAGDSCVRPYHPSRVRPCQYASWARSSEMVSQPSALCYALHARALFVDESSRTMVFASSTGSA